LKIKRGVVNVSIGSNTSLNEKADAIYIDIKGHSKMCYTNSVWYKVFIKKRYG